MKYRVTVWESATPPDPVAPPAMTARERADAFNRSIAETSRRVVEDGISCCAPAYWTENEVHADNCKSRGVP